MSTAAATADLSNLVSNLRYAHQNVKKVSEEILDETATSIEKLMIDMAPVDTGRLRASIRIVSAPGIRTIGPQGIDYAKFQEWGTGVRGEFPTKEYVIRPKKPGDRLHFEIDGKHVTALEVHHPGIPPNPFVRPSARQGLAEIGNKYGEAGVNLIMKGRNAKV